METPIEQNTKCERNKQQLLIAPWDNFRPFANFMNKCSSAMITVTFAHQINGKYKGTRVAYETKFSGRMRQILNSWVWIPSVTFGENKNEFHWTSLEKSENGCALTLPVQPGGTLEVLQRVMGQTAQRLVCQACGNTFKKTWGCNCSQSQSVLSKGCEY